jgi:hypothetical protein
MIWIVMEMSKLRTKNRKKKERKEGKKKTHASWTLYLQIQWKVNRIHNIHFY